MFDSNPSSMRNPNKTTIQSPFNLRSRSRYRARSYSPYRPNKTRGERSSLEFKKAMPGVPKFAPKSPRNTGRQERKYTKPVPFNLRSAQRAASPTRSYHSYDSHSNDESKRNFVARRMPNLAYRSPRRPREKHYTVPQPFHLHANNRISERRTEREHNESYRFIARPMPDLTYRPPTNHHSDHVYHPTRPVGFKLGYERDRELNPIPNMAHRYPPKPPPRESTQPHDFMFAYGAGREHHQYSRTWNDQYPDDNFDFPSTKKSFDETVSQDGGRFRYGGGEAFHYSETTEGVTNAHQHCEYTTSKTAPIGMQEEQAVFEQDRDHRQEYNSIQKGYKISFETLEGQVTTSKEGEREPSDSTSIVKDGSFRKEKYSQMNFDECKKDVNRSTEAMEEKDDESEMEEERTSTSNHFNDEEDKPNSCHAANEGDNIVIRVNESSSPSSYGASSMQQEESGHQEDPNCSKSREGLRRGPRKDSIAYHTDAPIQDREGEHQEDDISSKSQEYALQDLVSLTDDDPVQDEESRHQEDDTSSKSQHQDSIALVDAPMYEESGHLQLQEETTRDSIPESMTLTDAPSQEEESERQEDRMSSKSQKGSMKDSIGTLSDATSQIKSQHQEDVARDPVEYHESGHTFKFRQRWRRAPVEDHESGQTSKFRQGWYRAAPAPLEPMSPENFKR